MADNFPRVSFSEFDILRKVDGFFVGSLTTEELDIFERAVKMGIARRVYENAAAMLGVSKVRITGTPK